MRRIGIGEFQTLKKFCYAYKLNYQRVCRHIRKCKKNKKDYSINDFTKNTLDNNKKLIKLW